MTQPSLRSLEHHDAFIERHIGPNDAEVAAMLRVVGHDSLEALTDAIVPASIKSTAPLALPGSLTEVEALAKIRAIATKNQVFRSFIGQGYYGTHTPNVILRNILENPAWYTAYTPYQAEISQGRMEALINFQQMCADLTGMEIANASLLDEATAAAEAMTLAKRSAKSKSNTFLVSGDTHPQTLHVLQTRAEPLGLRIELANGAEDWDAALAKWFDVQFPPLEKHRTYARPSRRQGATPDIPRPGYAYYEQDLESRTFGVVVDTSGSMSAKQIGMALGSIASYAAAKDVPFVRIIFCDAKATDAGYLAPEDIAGRVKVTGRGGTILQPGVDCLEQANDFPKDGPILIITDGEIENDLKVRREHAFLLPRGNRLPFRTRGEVFYFRE